MLQYYEAKYSPIAAALVSISPAHLAVLKYLNTTQERAIHPFYNESPSSPPPHPRLSDSGTLFPHLSTLCCQPRWHLVPKFVNIIEQPVEGKRCLVGMRAVVAAFAGLDHHDVLGKRLSIFTVESHLHSPGLQGRAASAIHAGAAVLGTVLLHT